MRAFQIATLVIGAAALAGCASQHSVAASTPRSIEIHGTAWNEADNQKAFDLAESECKKNSRHASLVRHGGPKPNAWWNFDCVQ